MSIVVSCGNSIEWLWRTGLGLIGGKPFDNEHRATALGTGPKIVRTSLWCRAEQLKAKWQGGGTFAVGQEAEVPDAHETFRERMEQETAQELIDS